MGRPAVIVALPQAEQAPVVGELRAAGFDAVGVKLPEELEAVLAERRDVAIAVLDGERDFDTALEFYSLLHEGGHNIPALMVVSLRTLEKTVSSSSPEDEYFTRPYSVDALRWRIEAMCIRQVTVDDGSGPILTSGPREFDQWTRRASIVAVFNPKGGVGKTTIATNLASALQLHHGQNVLLVDADTVTGHVATSLGLEHVRTVADSWQDQVDGGPAESLSEIAAAHPSGLKVAALTSSPLTLDILDPVRVADAITACRRGFDMVVVDLHPSYSPLNQAIFDRSDRILVPVTPDVPALRAAVQLRDVATEIGIRDKMSMIVNRANSGVSVADMERTIGMPSLAQIRSGGLHFVRAANEGRTVIERFPKEKITEDFDALAERLLGRAPEAGAKAGARRPMFGRQKEPARASG